jgi:hypothetical protein
MVCSLVAWAGLNSECAVATLHSAGLPWRDAGREGGVVTSSQQPSRIIEGKWRQQASESDSIPLT